MQDFDNNKNPFFFSFFAVCCLSSVCTFCPDRKAQLHPHVQQDFHLVMLMWFLKFFIYFLFQFPFLWGYCLHGNLFQQLLNHHGLLLPGRASVGICCFLQHQEHQLSFQTICFYWIWFVALFSNSENPLSAKLMVLNNISWPKGDDKSDSGCAFVCMWRRREILKP